MKILVVDDGAVTRRVLDTFLKQSGHEVVVVEDGPAAFSALTAPDAPHVAIIDWMMPDITGPELCTKLCAHPFAIRPYLLILTGRNEKRDIVAALDAGADDFISKPFNIEEMQARLRVAERHVRLQLHYQRRLAELEEKLARHAEPVAPTTEPAAKSDPAPAAE